MINENEAENQKKKKNHKNMTKIDLSVDMGPNKLNVPQYNHGYMY